ncbi:MAG: pilus assembly PilX N-terminal domain-containing protein, partial [Thermoplasmata archaeon]|nr:pilus assembly PilX N-terminal domain-containing protein [Thermoplasmata archaeon]
MRWKKMLHDTRGSALVMALTFTLILSIAAAAFLRYVSNTVLSVRRQNDSLRAFFYAESGMNYAMAKLSRGWTLSRYVNPFEFLEKDSIAQLSEDKILLPGEPEEGQFHIEVLDISAPHTDTRDITLKSTGKYNGRSRTIVTTYRLELEPSRVFDYAYFMNHWGWFIVGSDFNVFGNIRANGHFSVSTSLARVEGHPEYEWTLGQKVYKDSGGIYSAFRIDDASGLSGMVRLNNNQHMNEDLNSNGVLDEGEDHNQDGELTYSQQIMMPNLNQPEMYEQVAKSWNDGAGSSIKIRGGGDDGSDLTVSDAVLGDEPDENEHLLVWGTADNPIVIDGPVVIRGALIIKGYVTGKGCIYSGDNIYIPDNLIYVNPPEGNPDFDYMAYSTDEERDAAWREASETWRTANADKDGIGLFARENIIMADFNEAGWKGEVSRWLNDKSNESAERANGLDHIPGTSDEGEGDSTWTVDYYTEQDMLDGLIPEGMTVGDVVPE